MNFSLTRPLSKIKFTRLNQIYGLFDPRFSIRWYTAGSESKASNQNYFIQKDKKKTTPNKPGFHEYSNLFNEHHLSHDQAFKGSPPSTNSQENTDESSEKKILPTIQFSNSELPLNQDWMSKYMKPGQVRTLIKLFSIQLCWFHSF
ncbi:hypothetical protein HMI56_004117 [Coelomomyces lativittatus]|nr:hypothetical protein HMI56_004117 [Coelomomyces lativittatus]